MHRLLWDFEIQMNQPISARRPDLIIINNKERTYRIVDFAVPTDHRVKLKKKCEKKDKYLDLARELRKLRKHELDDYTNCNWCSWYCHQRVGTRAGGLGNNETDEDCPNYSIVEIGQNTEKSLGELGKLAVTQTSVENHWPTLMGKTLKEKNNNFPFSEDSVDYQIMNHGDWNYANRK